MADLQEQQSALLDAQHLGLAELARLAGVREFFDTMVVVENFPTTATDAVDDPRALQFRGFTGTDSPHYPVSFVAYLDDQLTVEIKYDAGGGHRSRRPTGSPNGSSASSTAFAEHPDAAGRRHRPAHRRRTRTRSRAPSRGRARTGRSPTRSPPWPRTLTGRGRGHAAATEHLTYAELDARAVGRGRDAGRARRAARSPGSRWRCRGRST